MTAVTTHMDAPALGIEDLSQLMRSVSETTERLRHTHAVLQEEVARLQGELAEANDQLRRSRQLAALGEMAAGIAHEVRNPLASIRLYAQMVAEDVADRPPSAELCGRIAGAVERLDAIVRDVLHLGRDRPLATSPVRADRLIDEALETCRPLICRAGVTIAREGGDGEVELEADADGIVGALANVVRNAVEAMDEAGSARRELRVAAACRPRRVPGAPDGRRSPHVVLSVTDSGPGIAPETLKRMFNPFFTTRRTGTGLGLAIVHRLVDAHGGHVAVSSRPGEGSTVELCLPAPEPGP